MPGSPPWPSPATERAAGQRDDAATVAATAGAALRGEGVPVSPEQCQRFARSITLMHPPPAAGPDRAEGLSARELRACGLATLVSGPEQIEVLDRVFTALFGAGPPAPKPAAQPGLPGDPGQLAGQPPGPWQPPGPAGTTAPRDPLPGSRPGERLPGARRGDPARKPDSERELRLLASATERLGGRDFAELSPQELGQLEALMRQLTLATPLRRTRRRRRASAGDRADLRSTLRQARRTHGEPVKLARTAARVRPRRLVVLCDISGSMEPYARAMLQLLYCVSRAGAYRGSGLAGAARTEVFTFATRLTRITPELTAADFGAVLQRAGKAAPDWSGGTRIGAAVKDFNDAYGCQGMARGAVVLIISDGWETGDAAALGGQMARLSRVAHRIVWANPRTKSPRYRPEVSGMAAAWPYCDAVVSAHSLDALGDLIAALAAR